jgi:O-antigen/teichoic acid export membrane protein
MEDSQTPLRKPAQQAILWSAGLNLLRDGLQFAQMLVLVRLLDTAMYGEVAWATALINLIGIASFSNVALHMLQVRDDALVDYSEHFTAGIVLNGSLFVVANLAAIGLRLTETYVHLEPLVHLLSLTFLLRVPADIRTKMLERKFAWSRLRLLQMAGVTVTVASGITMAVCGAGVYALIVPGLLPALIFMGDLFLVERWRPKWGWSAASYRDATLFGLNRAGSNVLNAGRAFLQNTMITRYFAFGTLGVFGRADGLANMFCGRVSQEVTGALYPVVTRAAIGSERFQRISGLVLQGVAWVVLPVAAFFALESSAIVSLMYGQKWLAAIPLLPLAMAAGATVSVGSVTYQLLLANDKSRLCLRSDIVAFILVVAAVVVLVPHGVFWYLAGVVGVQAAVCGILMTLLVRTRGIHWKAIAIALLPPGLAAGLASAATFGLRSVLPNAWPEAARLAVDAAWYALVCLVVLRAFFFTHLAALVEYVPGNTRIRRLLWA